MSDHIVDANKTIRCYKCGRIAPESKSMERRLKIQTGGDGWREAEPCHAIGDIIKCGSIHISECPRAINCHLTGTDPAIVCPKCEREVS